MKSPVINESVRIKFGEDIFEERCADSLPDRSCPPYGWKFAVISALPYRENEQYVLVAEGGEETLISVASIATPSIRSKKSVWCFPQL